MAVYMEQADGLDNFKALGQGEADVMEEAFIYVDTILTHHIINEGQLPDSGHICGLCCFRERIVHVHLFLSFGEVHNAAWAKAAMARASYSPNTPNSFSWTTLLSI